MSYHTQSSWNTSKSLCCDSTCSTLTGRLCLLVRPLSSSTLSGAESHPWPLRMREVAVEGRRDDEGVVLKMIRTTRPDCLSIVGRLWFPLELELGSDRERRSLRGRGPWSLGMDIRLTQIGSSTSRPPASCRRRKSNRRISPIAPGLKMINKRNQYHHLFFLWKNDWTTISSTKCTGIHRKSGFLRWIV